MRQPFKKMQQEIVSGDRMFHDTSLEKKLAITLFLMILLVLCVASAGYYGMTQVRHTADELSGDAIPSLKAILTISDSQRAIVAADRALLDKRMINLDSRAGHYKYMEIHWARIDEQWTIYEAIPMSTTEAELWQKISTEWPKWQTDHQRFVELMQEKDELLQTGSSIDDENIIAIDAAAFQAAVNERQAYLDVQPLLDELVVVVQTKAAQVTGHADAAYLFAQRILLIATLSVIAIALLSGSYLTRLITRPVKELSALLEQFFDAIILVDPATKKIVQVNQRLCQLTGYSYGELVGVSLYVFYAEQSNAVDDSQNELMENQFLRPQMRKVRCKDGTFFSTERVATLIACNGKTMQLIILHDISEERKLQQQIHDDVHLAGNCQRKMLPADYVDEFVEVKGIYKPLRVVSGDFFDYRPSGNEGILTGYMVDVAGHGIAVALETSAINVLLREILVQELPPTESSMNKLNEELRGYFKEDSFAALICYHFDFRKGILTCAFGGINWILASCRQKRGWIKHKGSLIGAFDDANFDIVQIAIQPGDTFYFLTDGLRDRFPDSKLAGWAQIDKLSNLEDYPATVNFLSDLAERNSRDDCSAVCVRIHGTSDNFKFYFKDMNDVVVLHERIRRILTLWGKDQTKHLEIVVNEAINNVLLHGSGQGYIRLKRVKNRRIVIRVKDCQQGSDAGSVLQQYENESTEELLQMVDIDSGRGILLMKLFTDFIWFNRNGSEVLLVRKISI